MWLHPVRQELLILPFNVDTTVQEQHCQAVCCEGVCVARLAAHVTHIPNHRPAQSHRAGADQEEHWFAQLRLVLSLKDAMGSEHRLAFLRWLSSTGDEQLPMQRLTWAKQGPTGGPQHAWYDCVDIDTVERPVFLQLDPEHGGCFYYNHFMG